MMNRPEEKNVAPTPRTKLLDNRLFAVAFSLFCGVAVWMVVAMYFDPNTTVTIYDASVNYDYSASTYTSQGLDIVERPEIDNVRVKVEGNATVIGDIGKDDIMVYPSYASVKGAGETKLRLNARISNTVEYSGDIKLTVESPDSIDVVFDEVSEKVVPVTADTSGLSIAEGFTLYRAAAVPAEVTLRGPISELDQIVSVAAPVVAENELSDNTTLPATLELRGENGEALELEYTTLTSDSANVTLTVYQVRELPLAVDFIGGPTTFDPSSLQYTLSQETLRVAGPARQVSGLEKLQVTTFDLTQFAFDRDFQQQIMLPTGLILQDDISTVTLNFNTDDMAVTTLNISNIQPVNVPSNYDIQILSSLVNGVTLYGPKAEIEALSANSVQAQVDCQSLSLTAGQQTVPVVIQIPSSTKIFATGSYTVQCEVTIK